MVMLTLVLVVLDGDAYTGTGSAGWWCLHWYWLCWMVMRTLVLVVLDGDAYTGTGSAGW